MGPVRVAVGPVRVAVGRVVVFSCSDSSATESSVPPRGNSVFALSLWCQRETDSAFTSHRFLANITNTAAGRQRLLVFRSRMNEYEDFATRHEGLAAMLQKDLDFCRAQVIEAFFDDHQGD